MAAQPETESSTRLEKWSLSDVLAFEAAIARDADQPWDQLEKRDREIGEKAAKNGVNGSSNRALLRYWLNSVKKPSAEEDLPPHELFLESYRLATKLLTVVAIILGGSVALEFLRYQGVEPVNVSAFFGLFILLQMFFGLTTFGLFLLPSSNAKQLKLSAGLQLLRPILLGTARMIANFSARSLSGAQRQNVLSLAGSIRSSFSLYGSLLRWKLFGSFQVIAIAFNLGALAVMLMVVSFSDRAFGWQTTLNVSADSIHSLIQLIALPWTWLWSEGVGYPSLADIEGSRIVLKEGIRGLSSSHLVSWWPFLTLGLVAYGLLPRLLFLIWAGLKQNKALNMLDFRQASAQRIVERMKLYPIKFEAQSHDQGDVERKEALARTSDETSPVPCSSSASVFISETIWQLREKDELKALISNILDIPDEQLKLDQLTLDQIAEPDRINIENTPEETTFCFVFESWIPPLEETKQLLRKIRKESSSTKKIRILLAGKPAANGAFQNPSSSDLDIWSLTISQLGDPYCQVDPLSE